MEKMEKTITIIDPSGRLIAIFKPVAERLGLKNWQSVSKDQLADALNANYLYSIDRCLARLN